MTEATSSETRPHPMSRRFRGFMPVVVDVETGGFNAKKDALLEVAAVTLKIDDNGIMDIDEQVSKHIVPLSLLCDKIAKKLKKTWFFLDENYFSL